MLAMSDRLSQIRQKIKKRFFKLFKGIRNAVLSFHDTYNAACFQLRKGLVQRHASFCDKYCSSVIIDQITCSCCYMLHVLSSPFISCLRSVGALPSGNLYGCVDVPKTPDFSFFFKATLGRVQSQVISHKTAGRCFDLLW